MEAVKRSVLLYPNLENELKKTITRIDAIDIIFEKQE
jgi:hypothetical protein